MPTAGIDSAITRSFAALIAAALSALALTVPAANALAAEPASSDADQAEIHPEVLAELEDQAQADAPLQALLLLEDSADLTRVPDEPSAVANALQEVAQLSQSQVLADLMARADKPGDVRVVNRFWITNMLLVEVPASLDAVETLADTPGVDSVLPNFEVTAIEPESSEVSATGADDRTWGIDKIEAYRVWRELGIDGTGVRVATLDTGVDISHPELAGSMVTDDHADPTYPGGWMEWDPEGKPVSSTPHDSQFHGTHVAGTIHGKAASGVAIGVAPGAEMMHGLVLPGGSGTYAQVVAGMQWVVAPTDAKGNQAGRPADVLNMSLGAAGFHQELVAPTQAIREAGIFPAISIGNNCRPPLTTGSPGNVFEAVAVGATDAADDVSTGSCGGVVNKSDWPSPPAQWPDSYVKPDLTAPGVGVISAVPGGFYANLSGTSMAAPHVSGTVALMLAAAPGLAVTEAYDLLVDTSFFDGRYGDERPNPRFGHGRINAYAATIAATELVSGIAGTIHDVATGEPIANATVTVEGSGIVRSTADGSYHVRLSPGTYDLSISAFGYETTTIDAVGVVAGHVTTTDIDMQPLPAGRIAGTVALASSGIGVPNATIRVDGTPVAVATGVDGRYTADLPVGTWTVRAEAHGFPPADPVVITVTESRTTTADFALGNPLLRVGVLGDDGSQITQFLNDRGIVAEHVDWSEDPARYPVVIVNNPTDPGRETVEEFLAATDAAGTGVVFLDSWATPPLLTGVNVLVTHDGNPVSRGQAWSTSYRQLFYEVVAEHPILEGYEVGDRIVHDGQPVSWKVHAWFDGYGGEGTQVIANTGNDRDGIRGGGIAIASRPNNRHVLLSMHAATPSGGPLDWSDETGTVLINALKWAAPDIGEQVPIFVEHNLRADPAVVPRGEAVTVSVDVTNVGAAAGEYDAVLRIGGTIEATKAVELMPGQTTTVSWSVDRSELGTYQVGVDELRASFRVRGPLVDLTVQTLAGPEMPAEPLVGAAVDLVYGGTLRPAGTTGEDGRLVFEAPLADGDYTVVVRRTATNENELSYLLQRPERIAADTSVTFSPQVQGDPSSSWDRSAIVHLDLTEVTADHQAWTYLRSPLTAPYGFAVRPGRLVATVGEYEARHVHALLGLERDWWYASERITGLDWQVPTEYHHTFGGPARARLGVASGMGTQFTADWTVSDAAGIPFELAASTQLRTLDALPPSADLDDVPSLVRGRAAVQSNVVLTLTDPTGENVHDGVVEWSERSVARDLANLVEELRPGSYGVTLDADFGPYEPASVTARATLPGAALRWLGHSTIAAGQTVEVTVAFTATTDGMATVREMIGRAGEIVAQPLGVDWQVATWSASAKAMYDGHGTWTFPKLRAAEDVTLAYSLTSPVDAPAPSQWTLAGTVTEAGRPPTDIGGEAALTVAEPDVVYGVISGTVSDTATGAAIAGATVTANPPGITATTADDGSYAISLPPGQYDLAVSAFGYVETAVASISVEAGRTRIVDVPMQARPAGAVIGTVTFADSGKGVPGAVMEISGTPLSAMTGADGRFQIDGVPAGAHTVTTSAVGFVPPAPTDVVVVAGESAHADFALEPQLDVALVTSRPNDFNQLFTTRPDLAITSYTGRELAAAAKHELVIYGYEEYQPTDAEFQEFIAATDANGVGVIFLDQWFLGWGNGIRMLSARTGQPASVGSRLASGSRPSYYVVTAEHPILAGFQVGDRIPVDVMNSSPWISWFNGYTGDGRQVIADMGVTDATGIYGHGVGVDERPTNRHVLLASLGNNVLRSPRHWSADAEAVFWNAVEWAAPPRAADAPRFVEWNLQANPDTVLAGEPVEVSVDVTNVGASAGDHQVELLVDGEAEATTTVTLGAGETRTVSWTVTRSGLASYDIQVAHLSGRFLVRPPNVELAVHTLRQLGHTPVPMSGASVSLIHNGQLVPVGTTDDAGTLTFATPVAEDDYTIVVRRSAGNGHDLAYLLQRPIHVDADTSVSITPWSLPGGRDGWDRREPWTRWCDQPGGELWCGDPLDRSAVLDLALDPGGESESAVTYLRGTLTAPYGFAYPPGRVVATTGDYDLRHVHSLIGPAREWQVVGDQQRIDLAMPTEYTHPFGGPAQATLRAVPGTGTTFTADWSVGDAFGNSFELVAAAQTRPFAPLPDAVALEEVTEMVAGQLPDEAEVVLRVYDPSGAPVHAEGIAWSERPVGLDLARMVEEVTPGTYSVRLEADLGPYAPGQVSTRPAEFTVPAPEPSGEPDSASEDDGDSDSDTELPSEPPGPWTWRAGLTP